MKSKIFKQDDEWIVKTDYDIQHLKDHAKHIRDLEDKTAKSGEYQVAATVPYFLIQREQNRGNIENPPTQRCLMKLIKIVETEFPLLKLTKKRMA